MSAPIHPDTLAAAMAAANAALAAARSTAPTASPPTTPTTARQLGLFADPAGGGSSVTHAPENPGFKPFLTESPAARRTRSAVRSKRAASALATVARQLDLLGWVQPARSAPAVAPSPCTGCPRRAGCRAPCAALLAALGGPDPDARPDRERGSRSLMADRVYASEGMGARLSAAATGPWSRALPVAEGELLAAVEGRGRWVGVLTPRERELVGLLLGGREQRELPRLLGVSREAVSARLRSARGKLAEGLGVLAGSARR